MGQARTALSLTAAGSPFTGVPLTLASAQADAGPPRKNARHWRSSDGRSNALGFSGLIRRLALGTVHGALHQ